MKKIGVYQIITDKDPVKLQEYSGEYEVYKNPAGLFGVTGLDEDSKPKYVFITASPLIFIKEEK